MRAITINLGIKDGVESNLPVVDINGLIGKIEVLQIVHQKYN